MATAPDINIHYLKTDSQYFQAVRDGKKTFELRRNDRGFKIGDILVLMEIDHSGNYMKRAITTKITYILEGLPWLHDGYCALGFNNITFNVL